MSLHAFAAVVVTLLIAAAPAWAQTAWTAPGGRFGLTVPGAWEVRPAVPEARGLAIDLMATPPGEDAVSPKTACGVFRVEQALKADFDQTMANRMVAGMSQQKAVAEATRPRVSVTEVRGWSNEEVQGVRVAAIHHLLDFAGTPQLVWQAQFILAMNDRRMALVSVNCFAPQAAPAARLQEVQATFESLAFAVVGAV